MSDASDRLKALEPHYRYLLDEVLTVIPGSNRGHLRVIIHRHRHLLSRPEYAYDARMRRHRTLSLADIEALRTVYKPRVKGILRLIHRWASES